MSRPALPVLTRVPAPRVLQTAIATGLAVLAGGVYSGYFTGERPLLVIALFGLLGGGLALVGTALRWSGALTAVVATSSGALLSVFTLFRQELTAGLPGPAAWGALGQAVVHGWARMLSVAVPADPDGDLLLTPAALALASALAAGLLVLRTPSVLAPLAPPAAAFVVGLVLTVGTGRTRLGLTALFVALGLLLAVLRSGEVASGLPVSSVAPEGSPGPDVVGDRARGRLGWLAAGAPVVVLITGAAVIGAALLPVRGTDRADLRELRRPPVVVTDTVSPLARTKGQLTAEPTGLFSVTVPRRAPVTHVRTAALDTFDGAVWSSGHGYLRAGERLAVGGVPGERVQRVTIAVDVPDLLRLSRVAGPYLPVVGQPVHSTADDTGFDADSGVLVAADPRPGRYAYSTTGLVPVVDRASLRDRLPDLRTELTALPPGMPGSLRQLYVTWTAGQDTVIDQLTAVEQRLSKQFPYDPEAVAGHSYGALTAMLTSASPQDRRGTPEQHASALAVLARSAGLPARIAVGYRLDEAARTGNTYAVTTAHADAWVEVPFEGVGWVPFFPIDLSRAVPPAPRTGPRIGGEAGSDSAAPPLVRPRLVPDSGALGRGEAPVSPQQWAALGVGSAAGLMVAAALVVLALKARRRRRRCSTGTPAARVAGAWREVVERLQEHGMPPDASLTAAEQARAAQGRFGADVGAPVCEMAPLVTSAVFAAEQPAARDVERAWELEGRLRAQLAQSSSRPARLLHRVDPRPVLPRRRRTRVPGISAVPAQRSAPDPAQRPAARGRGTRRRSPDTDPRPSTLS